MKRQSLPFSTGFGSIRRARADDVDQIVQMVGRLAEHHGDTPTLTADDLTRDLFGEQPWISVIVAAMDQRLIGYAAMCGLIRLQFGARGMDMHHLFIDDDFRGKGVGRSLVEGCKIEAMSLSCRYLSVGTHPGNLEAQRFYTALGIERRNCFPPKFSMNLPS